MEKLYAEDSIKIIIIVSRSITTVLVFLLLVLLTSGCSTLKESSKYQFNEGFYKVSLTDAPAKQMYVDFVDEDSLTIYPLIPSAQGPVLDSLNKVVLNTSSERAQPLRNHYTFAQASFDIDILTIPFKYRPEEEGFPRQLNTSFQAAAYAGLRTDYYRMGYNKTPLGNQKRHFNHFGFSFGVFSGLGSTVMNESVTLGRIGYEYDGMVLLNGIAGIVGVNNFTLGLCAGIDHLLDHNREEWIYQHKPWIGLAFGLNLN